jgi:hypothetical protein
MNNSYSHYILRKRKLYDISTKESAIGFEDDVNAILSLPTQHPLTDRTGNAPAYCRNGRLEVGCRSENPQPFSTLVIDLMEPLPKERYPYWMVNTMGKNYDITVCAILLSLKHHFPELVQITTDGDRTSWNKGIAMYQYLFEGRKMPYINFQKEESLPDLSTTLR